MKTWNSKLEVHILVLLINFGLTLATSIQGLREERSGFAGISRCSKIIRLARTRNLRNTYHSLICCLLRYIPDEFFRFWLFGANLLQYFFIFSVIKNSRVNTFGKKWRGDIFGIKRFNYVTYNPSF